MSARKDGLIEIPASDFSEAIIEKNKNVVSTYTVALTCEGLACGSGTLIPVSYTHLTLPTIYSV